jgi:hypothetical protein
MAKRRSARRRKKPNKYAQVMAWVFEKRYRSGQPSLSFTRDDLVAAHKALKLDLTKNLGDLVYSFRFRADFPEAITRTAPAPAEWVILGTGPATYEFRLAAPGKIAPSADRERIPVLDATPEIVKQYAPGTDEQALLTRARYNRLVDLFLGLTCYSIQNHLRTSLPDMGQIEIDEIYLGVNRRGAHFAIPCQAKSPGDRFGIVQVIQDMDFCRARYPDAICRPVALQFQDVHDVAVLELNVTKEDELLRLNVVDEKHYRLCSASEFPHGHVQLLRDREAGSC